MGHLAAGAAVAGGAGGRRESPAGAGLPEVLRAAPAAVVAQAAAVGAQAGVRAAHRQ